MLQIGDIPDAEIKPPDNVLFVCKLNPVTEVSLFCHFVIEIQQLVNSIDHVISLFLLQDEDLHTIFSRFGTVVS